MPVYNVHRRGGEFDQANVHEAVSALDSVLYCRCLGHQQITRVTLQPRHSVFDGYPNSDFTPCQPHLAVSSEYMRVGDHEVSLFGPEEEACPSSDGLPSAVIGHNQRRPGHGVLGSVVILHGQ